MPGGGRTPAMSAVGLMCRQYAGTNPRNPDLRAGIKYLKSVRPGSGNIYCEYYATRVMFNAGGAGPKNLQISIDALAARMDARFDRMDAKFDALSSRMDSHVDRDAAG